MYILCFDLLVALFNLTKVVIPIRATKPNIMCVIHGFGNEIN